MAVVAMKQLLEAGVHFGHQTRRWDPKMAEYIFQARNGIHIIDLQKTSKKLDEAYAFLKEQAEAGKTVLFVGTKKQAQECVKEAAEKAKKELSNVMMKKENQEKIQKRARDIVAKIHGFKNNQKLTEDDITKQIDAIQELIKEGLWPAPGGAWCSAGVPIYDKMSECGGYQTFKHYD